jgi:hypothetical protein
MSEDKMNGLTLKKYIRAGKLDPVLMQIYGESAVAAQRERYLAALDFERK